MSFFVIISFGSAVSDNINDERTADTGIIARQLLTGATDIPQGRELAGSFGQALAGEELQ